MNNNLSNEIEIKWGFIYKKKDKHQLDEKIGKINLHTDKNLLLFAGEKDSGIQELTEIFYKKNNLFYINSVLNKKISPVFFYRYGINFYDFKINVSNKYIIDDIIDLFKKQNLLKKECNQKILELKEGHYTKNNDLLRDLNEVLRYERNSLINNNPAIKLWEEYKKRLDNNNKEITNYRYVIKKINLENKNQKDIINRKKNSNNAAIKLNYFEIKKNIKNHYKEITNYLSNDENNLSNNQENEIHNKNKFRNKEIRLIYDKIINNFISAGINNVKSRKQIVYQEKNLTNYYNQLLRIYNKNKEFFSKFHNEKFEKNLSFLAKLINHDDIINNEKFIEFENFIIFFANSKIKEAKGIEDNIKKYLLFLKRKLNASTNESKIKIYKTRINSLNYEAKVIEDLKKYVNNFLIKFNEYKEFLDYKNYKNIYSLSLNFNNDIFLFLYSLNLWKIKKKYNFYNNENILKKQIIKATIKDFNNDNHSINDYFTKTKEKYKKYQKQMNLLGETLFSNVKKDIYFKSIIFSNGNFTLRNPQKEIRQIKVFYSKINRSNIYQEKISQLDNIFEIKNILNKKYSDLTTFEKVKINLIFLLFTRYRFFVFDDRNFDVFSLEEKTKLIKILKKISKLYNIKIIFSLQKNQKMPELNFDQLFIIKNARIIEWGDYSKILKNPFFDYTKQFLNTDNLKYNTNKISNKLELDIETIFFYDEYKSLSVKRISPDHFVLIG